MTRIQANRATFSLAHTSKGLPILLTVLLAMASCDTGPGGGAQDVATSSGETAADGIGGVQEYRCIETAELLQLAACMVRAGEAPGEPTHAAEHAVEGTVIDIGIGMPPDNCFHHCDHIGGCLDEETMSWGAKWVRLEDADGEVWTAAIVTSWEPSWPAPGDHVSLEYRWQEWPFAPAVGALELRRDEELVVWLGVDGSPETLEAPDGFSFETGEAVCLEGDECGSWSMYLLDVSLDGQSGTAGYRTDPLHISGYRVVNAGVVGSTSDEVLCMDWFMADTRVLVWPDP